MDAYFSITVDARRNIVRIDLSGFFQLEDIARFVAARDAARGRLPGDPDSYATLVDIRGMKIQAQSIVAGFAQVLADPAVRSRRIAFVVDSGLARMQLSRAAEGYGRQFRSVAEAERWLRSPASAAAIERAA